MRFGVHWVLVGFVALLMVAVTASSALAQETVDVAVFELEGDGVDEDLLGTLTAVLRQEALQHRGYSLVTPAAIQRSDVALLLGCDANETNCLRQIADYVDGRVLIFGQVRRDQTGWTIVMEILDVEAGGDPLRIVRRLADSQDPVPGFQREVEAIFQRVGDFGETHLVIVAPRRDVVIRLAEVEIARGSAQRRGLRPGVYPISMGDRHAPIWEGEVELLPGESVEVRPLVVTGATGEGRREEAPQETRELPAEAVAEEQPREVRTPDLGERETRLFIDQSPRSNAGAYSLMATGLIALGGSGLMAYLMSGIEETISEENAAGTMTQSRYDELARQGRAYEGAQYALLGAGAGALLFGGGWAIVNSRRNARIQPRPGAMAGGAAMTLELVW